MLKYFNKQEWKTILIPSAGYFSDLYDLLIFNSIRVVSLSSLGFLGASQSSVGKALIETQLLGMVVGGFFFGYLSDRLGRFKTLYFSIVIYSIANLLNAFINDIQFYFWLRFIAGFGLAGELGSSVAHIGESLPNHKRTYAGMVLSAIGMLGATLAGLLGWLHIDWRMCYIIGAVMGFIILFFRLSKHKESTLYEERRLEMSEITFVEQIKIMLKDKTILFNYIKSVLIGAPVFFFVGIIISFAPEFGAMFKMSSLPNTGASIVWAYLMISLFDIVGGYFSKKIGSRKKTIIIFIFAQIIAFLIFMYTPTPNEVVFYLKTALLGATIGYWGTMILFGSELAPFKIRGLVSTSIPNLIRALLVVENYFFKPLNTSYGLMNATLIVGFGVFAIALLSAYLLPEKFEESLDF
jgi:MFS transporter, putative metabolite:H+ symporter